MAFGAKLQCYAVFGIISLSVTLLSVLHVQSVGAINIDNPTAGEMTPFLEMMRNHGEKEKKEEEKKQNIEINQFLVAAVVSKEELDRDADNLKSYLLGKGRLQVVLNTNKNRCHGEKIFFDGCGGTGPYYENMKNKLKTANGGNSPIVLLYSHFIPCANVGNTKSDGIYYQCSEVLFTAASKLDLKMIIGYGEPFVGTHEERSKWFMLMGQIHVFKRSENVYIKDNSFTPQGDQSTLQNWMFQCLTNVYLPLPRGTASCFKGRNPEVMFSYFINNQIKNCLVSLGHAIDKRIEKLEACMLKEIESMSYNACPMALLKTAGATEMNRRWLKSCVQTSFRNYGALGYPNRQQLQQGRLYLASNVWVRINVAEPLNEMNDKYKTISRRKLETDDDIKSFVECVSRKNTKSLSVERLCQPPLTHNRRQNG